MVDFKKERAKKKTTQRPDGVSVASLLQDASHINAADEGRSQGSYLELPASAFEPDETQPRKVFDEEALTELRVSIEDQGQIQPIVVRRSDKPGVYRIVAGERRWRAIKGSSKVQVVKAILSSDPHEELRVLLVQLEENNRREDVPLIDTANAFLRVVNLSKSQKEASERLNMSPGRLSKYITLAKAPEDIAQLSKKGEVQDLDTLYSLSKANEKNPEAVVGLIAKWREGSLNSNLRKEAIALQKGIANKAPQDGAGGPAGAQTGSEGAGNVTEDNLGGEDPGTQSSTAGSRGAKKKLAMWVSWSIEGEEYRGYVDLKREPGSENTVWVSDGETGRSYELPVTNVSLAAVVAVK